ncbi:hypothetical protein Hanom_Chr14g01320881 [Helianthus anomalus]
MFKYFLIERNMISDFYTLILPAIDLIELKMVLQAKYAAIQATVPSVPEKRVENYTITVETTIKDMVLKM